MYLCSFAIISCWEKTWLYFHKLGYPSVSIELKEWRCIIDESFIVKSFLFFRNYYLNNFFTCVGTQFEKYAFWKKIQIGLGFGLNTSTWKINIFSIRMRNVAVWKTMCTNVFKWKILIWTVLNKVINGVNVCNGLNFPSNILNTTKTIYFRIDFELSPLNWAWTFISPRGLVLNLPLWWKHPFCEISKSL